MLFHAGVLWRLAHLGLLARLDRVSSVSGGSITAGVLGLNWTRLDPRPGVPTVGFESLVVRPLRALASTTVDEPAILGGILLPGTISDHVAALYAKRLFGDATLQDLPDAPRFVINATSVQSGVLMRFSKPYMRDYRVGQVLRPKLPLARAVAASSAFPPVLSPCEIDMKKFGLAFEPAVDGEDLHREPYTTKLVLTDGGVYDNLGLESALKRYDTLLVSDAGGHYQPEEDPHGDWARHSFRILDLVDSQVRALRARQLIGLYQMKLRKGAYWSIRQTVDQYPAPGALSCPAERTRDLAATPTRLAEMEDDRQQRLINWGYAVCDASLRSYFDASLPAPATFPYPSAGV